MPNLFAMFLLHLFYRSTNPANNDVHRRTGKTFPLVRGGKGKEPLLKDTKKTRRSPSTERRVPTRSEKAEKLR